MATNLNKEPRDGKKGREGGIWGLSIENNNKYVYHSQFADDTFMLGGASKIIARWFKPVFDQYLDLLGGFIDKTKSLIIRWNCPLQNINEIVMVPGFPLEWNGNYLNI